MSDTQPTHQVCPKSPAGQTHHLIPRRQGGATELTCIWCRQTESQIRTPKEES